MPADSTLLCVSTLAAGTAITDVRAIFAAIRAQAVADGTSGAMVFDGAGFCLYLEGARDAIGLCIDRHRADTRCAEVEVLHHGAGEARRYRRFVSGYSSADGPPATEQLRALGDGAAMGRFVELSSDFDLVF